MIDALEIAADINDSQTHIGSWRTHRVLGSWRKFNHWGPWTWEPVPIRAPARSTAGLPVRQNDSDAPSHPAILQKSYVVKPWKACHPDAGTERALWHNGTIHPGRMQHKDGTADSDKSFDLLHQSCQLYGNFPWFYNPWRLEGCFIFKRLTFPLGSFKDDFVVRTDGAQTTVICVVPHITLASKGFPSTTETQYTYGQKEVLLPI